MLVKFIQHAIFAALTGGHIPLNSLAGIAQQNQSDTTAELETTIDSGAGTQIETADQESKPDSKKRQPGFPGSEDLYGAPNCSDNALHRRGLADP